MDFFLIYEDCKIVSGYKNNIFYDLTRNDIYSLPAKVIEVLKYNRAPYSNIPNSIKKYADFFIEQEFATKLPLELLDSFPSILNKNHVHNINSVIIFCKLSIQQHEWIVKSLTHLGGEYITIRADLYTKEELLLLIEKLIFHGFTRIDLIFKNEEHYDKEYTKITGIGTIVIYDSTDKIEDLQTGVRIVNKVRKFEISISDSESKIDINNFMINRKNFILNHHVNSYFSQKIFIDSEFNIKNSIECKEVYGNINTIGIEEFEAIINSKSFRKYDIATKDKFVDCTVCEFRYCCNDNRLPIKRKDNLWYHKTECNYNPYIAKWKGEEGYLSLTDCGVVSNKDGFSIDHKRIAEINDKLWGE